MTKKLSLILAAAVIALFGAYHIAGDTGADDEQEFQRDKCIENCG